MNDYIDTTFEFQGNTFPLRILTGSVIDTNARSDTHVTGGGSYVSGNRTHVSEVRSHVEITQNLWLQCASGMERHLQFKTDFPVRAGHVLQIALLVGYDNDNIAWECFDNITTGQGWTATRPLLNAKTTSEKIISLKQHRLPLRLFWLVIYPLLAGIVAYMGFQIEQTFLPAFLSAFYVFLIFAIFWRLSQKNASPEFKNAAIAKYNAMQTQRAEAVEQLKASLAGTATSEIATVSGVPQ